MDTTTASSTQPRWDLTNIFSRLGGDDYTAAFAELDRELTGLEVFCQEKGIERLSTPPTSGAKDLAATVEQIIVRLNRLSSVYETLEAYVYGHLTTNSYDELALRETSKLELLDVRRQQIAVRVQAWLGSLGNALEDVIQAKPILTDHAFFLRHTAKQARYLMSEEMEALAAELCVDGPGAFGKLQGNVTSQLKVPLEQNGKTELTPITVVHNLCFHPDAEMRRRGYYAELEGWHSVRTTVAASLNAVKGAAHTLARRRGRSSVLEAALEQNRIDQPTLDALLGAIRESFPMFRRYLRAKAKRLGHEQLPWWDLFAPLGDSHRAFTFTEARDFIVAQFGHFSPDLGAFAARAFDRRWIDAEPRDGKRGGAYCMAVVGVDESRILANFDGSFEQLMTLAHELGHAYHNECQTGLEPLRRGAPSTLAETASIFCETLVAEAALAEADDQQRLTILEAQIGNATQVCLDISSRFLFESAVFERRPHGELSADELCELMRGAQEQTYGDAVQPETYHRYMWLWKPHYYSYAGNFYNFPYAFGHLFSLGLFARFQKQGAAFVPSYRDLLRATAQDYAAPLAERFGIDIRQPDFWRQSLAVVGRQIERFESL